MRTARLMPVFFVIAAPAALSLALAAVAPSESSHRRPSAAEIEHAVARAHALAERAGGRPGSVALAGRGGAR